MGVSMSTVDGCRQAGHDAIYLRDKVPFDRMGSRPVVHCAEYVARH